MPWKKVGENQGDWAVVGQGQRGEGGWGEAGTERNRGPQWRPYPGWSQSRTCLLIRIPDASSFITIMKTRCQLLLLTLFASYLLIIFVRHKHWDNFTFLLNEKDQVGEMNQSISTQLNKSSGLRTGAPELQNRFPVPEVTAFSLPSSVEEQNRRTGVSESPSYGITPSASRPLLQKKKERKEVGGQVRWVTGKNAVFFGTI